ncbi:hypothetical protein ABFB09_06230 [Dehalogenimonas sp. THU2]|uniref:hypothetical protein n=1 Tax=Dehalogenimonas sp. THU2 TaxID=3151121 RepID=UPI00321814C8
MPDAGDYKSQFHQEEAGLLARRKTLLGQKILFDHIFTTEAARRRKELEQELSKVERRIMEIRAALGENISNN